MNRALFVAAVLLLAAVGYMLVKSVGKESTAPPVSISSVPVWTTARTSESNETYRIDVEYPQFGIPAIDEKIAERAQRSIERFKSDVAVFAPPPDSAVQQYEFVMTFDSVYVGSELVSARIISSSYLGGAHPMHVVNGLNFMRMGEDVSPPEAYAMTGLSLEEIATDAKQELAARLGDSLITPEGADPTIVNYSVYVIGADSVTFFFQPYQVAPYAAGVQSVLFERVE